MVVRCSDKIWSLLTSAATKSGGMDLVVALGIIRCLQVGELKLAGRYFFNVAQNGSAIR